MLSMYDPIILDVQVFLINTEKSRVTTIVILIWKKVAYNKLLKNICKSYLQKVSNNQR